MFIDLRMSIVSATILRLVRPRSIKGEWFLLQRQSGYSMSFETLKLPKQFVLLCSGDCSICVSYDCRASCCVDSLDFRRKGRPPFIIYRKTIFKRLVVVVLDIYIMLECYRAMVQRIRTNMTPSFRS